MSTGDELSSPPAALPPFSGMSACCPKCGSPMDVKWHPSCGAEGGYPCWLENHMSEHHCRTCPCCGYGWMEATLDVNARKEAAT
jgi:hypothetical protein